MDLGAVTSLVNVDGKPLAKLDVVSSMRGGSLDYKINSMDNVTEVYSKGFNITIPEDTFAPDQNPAYYEKMKERLENLIREEKTERKDAAYYFNNYKDILEELYGQEKERKKLGFTNNFEFAVFEELLRLYAKKTEKKKDADQKREWCKKITKKISSEIKPEIQLVDWRNNKSSEKQLSLIIEDILLSGSADKKQVRKAIDNDNLIQRIIELAKVNL